MKYSNLILKTVLASLAALAFGGCIAKNAPKPAYYELSYEPDFACTAQVKERAGVYVSSISALPMYESRAILYKNGAEVKYLPNAKFIAYPTTMLAKSISNYLGASCDFRQVLGDSNAQIKLKIRIVETSVSEAKATISALARVQKDDQTRDAKLTAKASIAEFNESNALAALNEANKRLIMQIAEFLRQ